MQSDGAPIHHTRYVRKPILAIYKQIPFRNVDHPETMIRNCSFPFSIKLFG